MRTKSLSLALTLTLMLTTAAIAAPRTRQPKTPDGPSDVTVIERVVRSIKKIVRSFGDISVPVPSVPTTTT